MEQHPQTIETLSSLQLKQDKVQAIFITAQHYFPAQISDALLKRYATYLFVSHPKSGAQRNKFLLTKTGHGLPLPCISDFFITRCHLYALSCKIILYIQTPEKQLKPL